MGTALIYGLIGTAVSVFMENIADKMFVPEHFSLMQQGG
jgi:hypothetical protein